MEVGIKTAGVTVLVTGAILVCAVGSSVSFCAAGNAMLHVSDGVEAMMVDDPFDSSY